MRTYLHPNVPATVPYLLRVVVAAVGVHQTFARRNQIGPERRKSVAPSTTAMFAAACWAVSMVNAGKSC